jgi:predicted esterase
MEKRFVSFSIRARYYLLGELSPGTKKIWYVLHGQGQLAYYFSKKFESLVNDETCVIVPEGLSKYYLDGFYGKVGASWMTKDERQLDIDNYLMYLQSCREEIGDQFEEINVLGFSQGAATASRWVMQTDMKPTRLILWAGIFPPDLPFNLGSEKLSNTEVIQVYGTNDPYLTPEKIEEQTVLQQKLGVQVEVKTFDGGHEIDQNTLASLV